MNAVMASSINIRHLSERSFNMMNDNSPVTAYSSSNWSGCSRTDTRSKTLWRSWKNSGRSPLTCPCMTSLLTGNMATGSAPRSGPVLTNSWTANIRKGRLAAMINSETKRLCGRYLAENKDDFLKAYHIVMDVKETDKSYIMQLIEFNSRYSASHISLLFSKSKRVLLSKKRGGFSIKNWGDNTFTFYPFQAGIPYYFEKLPDAGSEEKDDVQAMQSIQPDCLECESKDCAYNRDGICRFSKVFDRVPSITEEDGCTEFVIRSTY